MRHRPNNRRLRAEAPRTGRPFGPYPVDSDGLSVKIPVRDGLSWAWARVDADELRRVLAHRWIVVGGYPATWIWNGPAKKGTFLALHRMVTNAPAGVLVDHKRGNTLDARRSMLRFATPSQNSANRRASRRGRSAKHRGVTLHRQSGRWQAQAKHRDKNHYLGLYETQEEAAQAYNRKARELWGPFAVLNRLPARLPKKADAERLAA